MKNSVSALSKAQGEVVGSFTVRFEVGSADRGEFREVEGLVDTGSTFSRIPASLLLELHHEKAGRERFRLGDGRVVEYDLADVPVRLAGKVRTTTCMWDEAEAQPVLGAVSLEQFLLAVDPVEQRLVGVDALLM
ncbi:MAG: hypothetical protein ACRD1T_24645, partial [Acidimicrobiia bacterium]